ncbi:hypothetical protein ANACOL_01441 [Anaerotruncus colihominis DSM 17241]|uniref:Uncharacterized protein n=1 Tax=Anaerotruncus colihominis DSM 17241 TaxID=445972 RepID=B0P9H3_9FIRM|nr:hypothetical protein ANACOL_01441 [Anaerotruncus colihominis DSM 17241]
MGRALRKNRLRRQQWGGRCVKTGCAANSGTGAAWRFTTERTGVRPMRSHRPEVGIT